MGPYGCALLVFYMHVNGVVLSLLLTMDDIAIAVDQDYRFVTIRR